MTQARGDLPITRVAIGFVAFEAAFSPALNSSGRSEGGSDRARLRDLESLGALLVPVRKPGTPLPARDLCPLRSGTRRRGPHLTRLLSRPPGIPGPRPPPWSFHLVLAQALLGPQQRTTRSAPEPARTLSGSLAGNANESPRRTGMGSKLPSK